MPSRKRSSAPRTGPASYKRAKTSAAIQSASTLPRPKSGRVEVKRIYGGLWLGTTTTALGLISSLPYIAAGDDSSEREGRAVRVKGYEVRGWITSGTTGGLVRVVVFKWKQSSTSPSVAAVLQQGGTGISLLSSYNINQSANYEVLRDKVYHVNPQTLAPGGATLEPREQYVHLYGSIDFTQTYSSQGSTSPTDNSIHVIVCGMGVAGSTVSLQSAISFIDM